MTLTNVDVSSMAIVPRAPSEPTTVFVGTHDGIVFMSSDGGATRSLIFSSSYYNHYPIGVSAGILDLAIVR